LVLGMIKIYSITKVIGVLTMGLIECDTDLAAARLVIIDRTTMLALTNRMTDGKSIIKKLVPITYTNTNNIMVGILDDSGTYNATFVDGVKAQLVDANVVDMT
jgi:uncharacterized membrane protein (Fun14 family)